MPSHEEILKDIVSQFLEKMDFFVAHIDVSLTKGTEDTLFCSVRVEKDQHFLIGQYGANLAAVQHIVRALFRKRTGISINIIIDVNDYFLEKKTLLEREAQKAIDEVLMNNISVSLRPMLPYERKIVHAYVSGNERVSTESIGKGNERKVLVRPRPMTEV